MTRRLALLWLALVLGWCAAVTAPRVAVLSTGGAHCIDISAEGGNVDLFICRWR